MMSHDELSHLQSIKTFPSLVKYLRDELGLDDETAVKIKEIAKSLGLNVTTIHDLFKPEVNLAIGVGYLTRLIAQFHSFKLGLLAYNQGPAVIREQLSSQTPLSIRYYNRVLNSYFLLQKSARTSAPVKVSR